MKDTKLKPLNIKESRLCKDFLDAKPHTHTKDDPWWINSPEDSFCFWEFIFKNSNNFGVLKELSTQEMADLLGWTTSKTLTELKISLEQLKENMDDDFQLEELLQFVELSKKVRN